MSSAAQNNQTTQTAQNNGTAQDDRTAQNNRAVQDDQPSGRPEQTPAGRSAAEDTTPPDVRATDVAPAEPGEGSNADAQRAKELLAEERASIDNIDAALVHLLAERFRHTQRVGRLKARHSLPPADPDREKRQVARLRTLADEAGLDPTFAEAFLRFIVTEVIRHHEHIRADETGA